MPGEFEMLLQDLAREQDAQTLRKAITDGTTLLKSLVSDGRISGHEAATAQAHLHHLDSRLAAIEARIGR